MRGFKRRGLPVEVVTTDVTELDVALYGVAEERLEQIGAALKAAPILSGDLDIGGARLRRFADLDVAFIVTADDRAFVITIGNIQPIGHEPSLDVMLRRVGIVAMLRGASGV